VPIEPATDDTIAAAARYIQQGGVVAFPTETVYGLGADATNDIAVAGIFSIKGRPVFNPLISHVPNITVAARFAVVDDRTRKLAAVFWPGPLTLVLKKLPGCAISELATAGLDTVAFRCPAHPVALALIAASRTPIAAPSANKSGQISPTTAEHVAADLGDDVKIILDAGPTEVGLESTVLDLSAETPCILRPGVVTADEIAEILGQPVLRQAESADPNKPASPGQLASHYAPRAKVRLNASASNLQAGEALLAFGNADRDNTTAIAVTNLSPSGNMMEAAANLFAALRTLDATGAETIAVEAIPETGLGEAINDRLRRAAAPR
jgi:L-threonylcarbamoyladenylate synthase